MTGNLDGRVQVVEFFDYSCGYCRVAMSGITEAMARRDDVKLILKEFPIHQMPGLNT